MNEPEDNPQLIRTNLPLWSYQLQQDSKLAVKTRKDLEIHLITRALKNEEFRQELIANPKAVVEKELGVKLPEELEIKVLEETESTLYMVVPSNPYEGIFEEELKVLVGMTYENVACWVLEQQRNTLLDENSSVMLIAEAWRDEVFKQKLLANPMAVISQLIQRKLNEEFDGITIIGCEETAKNLYIVLPSSGVDSMESWMQLPLYVLPINMPIAGSGGAMGTSCAANVCPGQRLPAAICTDERCPKSTKTGYGCDYI
ncbi:MAG: NHLP leader peptide family RiPP precursor [Nostochopsis sp.]